MAKTKPSSKGKRNRRNGKAGGDASDRRPSAKELLEHATLLLQTGEPEAALKSAAKAYKQLQTTDEPTVAALPALTLLGEICVELGLVDEARGYFTLAAEADPDGAVSESQGGGAEKFMWLAQLSEEGGMESVGWFERGAEVLRAQIAELTAAAGESEGAAAAAHEKRHKLASALCGIAEVFMTDLSFDDAEAEQQCERAVSEALLVSPDRPEVLQTVASVRISQTKQAEARDYLTKSIDIWKDLPPEDPDVPDFPTRISLARLLMEVDMFDEASEVLDRLIVEDNTSVEAWYLCGWCYRLIGEREQQGSAAVDEQSLPFLQRSRRCIRECLKLYGLVEYEDERLKDHAEEILRGLETVLAGHPDQPEDEDDDDWEDDEGDGDDMSMADGD